MKSPERDYLDLESLFRTFREPGEDDDKASAPVAEPRGPRPAPGHAAAAEPDEGSDDAIDRDR